MGIAHISNLRQQIYRKAPDEYHQVLFIVPYCESLEELHRSLTGREAGVPYGCQLMLPHSGNASNTFVFTSIQDRLSSGPAAKLAPIMSAFGIWLAVQAFAGIGF